MHFKKSFEIIKLLLWKSWKIRFHYKCCSITLFVLPLILPALFVFTYKVGDLRIRERVSGNGSAIPAVYSEQFDLFSESFKEFNNNENYNDYNCTLLYTPSTDYTRNVMQNVLSIFEENANVSYKFNINVTANETEMRSYLYWKSRPLQRSRHEIVCGGIVFKNINVNGNGNLIPKSINYDIVISDFVETGRLYTSFGNYFRSQNGYVRKLFIALQAAVDISHIKLINRDINLNLVLQTFPQPSKEDSASFDTDIAMIMSLTFSFSLLFIFPVTVKRIVEEKSTRVKEYLNCCGINQLLYWTTTNFDTFCLVSIQTLALYILFAVPQRYSISIASNYWAYDSHQFYISIMESFNTSNTLMLFTFIVYCWQTSAFASFLSIFFDSPNVAAAASIVLWIISTFYPVFVFRANLYTTYYTSIFPNCGLFFLLYIFKGRHYMHQSYNGFHNIFERSRWDDTLNAFQVLSTMILSALFYSIVTWYLTEVWPWQKGVKKSWYFPFAKYYNRYILKKERSYDIFESESLTLSKISKSYSKKNVLKDISFQVEDKSLTVLLGPNGSGKSTLINIICGLSAQTKGNVYVKGNDTEDHLEMAQSYLGFCPQHNTYFKYLTVKEQMEMIYTLKCTLRQRMDGFKVDEVIQMLNLQQFAHQMANNLSSGILRRTTLAMAMVGPSDVLVIDEPTESLDPIAKRKVWDILVEARKTKAMLVCSHQLDEVNVIADKVAIIAFGELKCVKSTLELKREYGMGYTIKIKRNTEYVTNDKIRTIFEKYSTNSKYDNFIDESEELNFYVPFDDCNQMSSLFKELEMQQFSLGIESMSLQVTTLEDIYSEVIQQKTNERTADEWQFDMSTPEEEELNENIDGNTMRRMLLQFQSLVLKNFRYQIRNYSILIILVVIPLILILITMVLFHTALRQAFSPKHKVSTLDQSVYKDSYSFIDSSDAEYTAAYKTIANTALDYDQSGDVQNWILSQADTDLVEYFEKFLYGVSFLKTIRGKYNITVWFNPSAVHSLPISLNMAMNAFLRNLANDNSYSIKVENVWFAETIALQEQEAFLPNPYNYDLILQPYLLVIYAFCYSAYVLRPIIERTIGFKHLQLMTGTQPFLYWLSHFAIDLCLNILCSLFHIAFIYLIDTDNIFAGSDNFFISLFTVYFFAGFSYIPFVYCFSFMFKKPTSAYLFLTIFFIILGFTLFPVELEIVVRSANPITTTFLILAPFLSLPFAIVNLFKAYSYNTFCSRVQRVINLDAICSFREQYSTSKICCKNVTICNDKSTISLYGPHYPNFLLECHRKVNPLNYGSNYYSDFNVIGLMIVSGLVYGLIANIMQYYSIADLCRWIKRNLCNQRMVTIQTSQSDEVKEEIRYVNDVIKNKRIIQESLVIQNLTKQFKSLQIPNNLNLSVRKGECFGLIGGNASGKTTTFKLLTSQIRPTLGNAFINDRNISLSQNTRKYLSLIGYCPQNDALLDCLTGIETLQLFMKLRGLNNVSEMMKIVKKFHLQSVINQRVSTYSGGNRRKLSLALALIGNQKLLLLDEPTNGVDPCSRHKVWQLLRNISESFQVSILLTSHNMQEVESLCTRIAVMSIGKMQCIGSVNDLRERYGKGFNLVVKVNREVAENEQQMVTVKSKISDTFYGETVNLKYENFGVMYYNITSNSILLSNIFEKLEEIRETCQLEDYFVSNANLEQSLLLFMKNE